jgi:signal transduction histidine kinase
MRRWRFFPSVTARRTSLLLCLGMAMIYVASAFVFSIYEYGNRFKPNPMAVRTGFIRVVKLSQAVADPYKNFNLFHAPSLISCVMTDDQLKGKSTELSRDADCRRLQKKGGLEAFQEIHSFTDKHLGYLQEKHVGKYHFRVRLKKTWVEKSKLIDNFIRIVLMSQDITESDKRLGYMNRLGFMVTLQNVKPSKGVLLEDMNLAYLRQVAEKNIYHLDVYRQLDDKRYLVIKRDLSSSRIENFVRVVLLTQGVTENVKELKYSRSLGFNVEIQNSKPTHGTELDDVNVVYLQNFAKDKVGDLDAYRKLDDGRYLVINPENYITEPMWLIVTSPIPFNSHPPVVMFGFYTVAGVFLLAIIGLCTWAVRRASVPVNKLLLAAKRFGRDLQAPPMAVEGCPEMRDVIIEYNNMQEKIRRLVLDRTQMLAAISHDLRTPITRLLMRIEYLQGSPQYEKAVKDLKEMDQMIRSILSFAREYASNEVMERFDLGALLESICSDLQDTNLAVEYNSADVHQIFFGRVTALKRAFSNIIENAVKYGDHALVSLEILRGEVVIKVKDQGPGIPDIEMEKVFAPFYRVDPARNPEKSGSGLGLAVSRDIVRSHAGDIKLYNSDRAGEGLVVVIHLPLSE